MVNIVMLSSNQARARFAILKGKSCNLYDSHIIHSTDLPSRPAFLDRQKTPEIRNRLIKVTRQASRSIGATASRDNVHYARSKT